MEKNPVFCIYFRKPSCELFYWLSLKIGIHGVNKFLTMNILIYQQYRSVLRLKLGNVRKEKGVSNQICFNRGYFDPHLFLSLCPASNAWPILTHFVPNSESLYLLMCLEAQLQIYRLYVLKYRLYVLVYFKHLWLDCQWILCVFRSLESQLFNKVNELQEDISMKRFDLRSAQIQLSAVRAQVNVTLHLHRDRLHEWTWLSKYFNYYWLFQLRRGGLLPLIQ